MQPTELSRKSFTKYPNEARALAEERLELLRSLPLIYVPLLLREIIAYDWKLSAERLELRRQLTFLDKLPAAERTSVMRDFSALTLNPSLEKADWVNSPSSFTEQLTAWLWSSGQMERFRAGAETLAVSVERQSPAPGPSRPRLGIVLIGAGSDHVAQPLFRKLRPMGVHLSHVVPDDGRAVILEEAERRAAASRAKTPARESSSPDYLHWYIDGGPAKEMSQLTQVSYAALDSPRALLLQHVQRAIDSGHMDPEEMRSLLARMTPSDIGLGTSQADDPVLNHFKLSLLTEGAGAQIFATTFVQWTAREAVRRAQPETLLARYVPRQAAQTMNSMLSGAAPMGDDPEGSLRDADMGAYYTWLEMRRLSGGEDLRFLVWREGQNEAMVIGPGLPRGTSSDSRLGMHQVLAMLKDDAG